MIAPDASPFAGALAALDLLLRREVLRLRARYQLSQQELAGMFVSDEQVDALLRRRVDALGWSALDAEIGATLPRAMIDLRGQHAAWADMVSRLTLDEFDELVVLLALAPVLHEKYLPLYAYLNDDASRRFLTQGLVRRLARLAAGDCRRWRLGPQGRLCRLGLVETIDREAGLPAAVEGGLRLSAVLAGHLLGAEPGEALASPAVTVTPLRREEWDRLPIPQSLAAALSIAGRGIPAHPVALLGQEGSGRRRAALNLLASHAPIAFELDARRLGDEEAPQVLRETLLAARLAGGALLLHEAPGAWLAQRAGEIAGARIPLVVLGNDRQRLRGLFPGIIECDVPAGSVEDRRRQWAWHLGRRAIRLPRGDLAEAADLFALSPRAIEAAAGAFAAAVEAGLDTPDRAGLMRAARRGSRIGFASHADRVEDGYTLTDLVLPPAVRRRIEDFIAACRNRRQVYEEWGMQRRLGPSRGLAALFSGSSGTGKSMAASAIAKALSLDLYRIELSAIVSKYIGETEKNLDEVFAAARAANCILFFDEADALFGKRSEVKDAHDRYANIECAYLLQKMERHDGLTMLTTNMPRSLDQAFSRRIQFVIEFPRPDTALREALWRGMFPAGFPFAEEIDFAYLGRSFELTGGEIRNIALDSALGAARHGAESGLTMLGLLEAVERQMIKQGRAPTAAAFKQHLKPLRQVVGQVAG